MKALVLVLLLGLSAADRQTRGLGDDLRTLWTGLNKEIDHLQAAADAGVQQWASQLEVEMEPAMEKMGQTFENAFDAMADTFASPNLFSFTDYDQDGTSVIQRQDENFDDPDKQVEVFSPGVGVRVPQTRMPGLGNIFGLTLDNSFPQGFDPMSIFGGRSSQWFEGPNVCVSHKLIVNGENVDHVDQSPESGEVSVMSGSRRDGKTFPFVMGFSSQISSCEDGPTFHECTTVTTDYRTEEKRVVTHECCYGFTRQHDTPAEQGCYQLDLKPLRETVKEMHVDEFLQLLETKDMMGLLDNNVTVFVPSNDAVEDFRHELQELNIIEHVDNTKQISYDVDDGLSYRRKRELTVSYAGAPQLTDILKGHIVEGFVGTNDINDESRLKNVDSDNKIRMTVYNTYPEKVVMANCARVTSRDHFATNGVAHVVDRVILPAVQTLGQIVQNDVQLRTLAKYLEKAGLLEDLMKAEGQFTLFAPTDEAFADLNDVLVKRLSQGNGCSQDILNNHILPNVICSGVIDSKAKTINKHNKFITLDRDEEGQLFVDGVKVVVKDVVGTNGVLHIIDYVLVPESARGLSLGLMDTNRPLLMELFQIAGLEDGMDTLSNLTLFGPSEEALAQMGEDLERLKQDPEALKNFLMFHLVTPKTCRCELRDGMKLNTGIEDKKIRINTYSYSSMPGTLGLISIRPRDIITAQCAKVVAADTEFCGGHIHTVNKPLEPAADSILSVVETRDDFSKFNELMEFAEVKDELRSEEVSALLDDTKEVLHTVFAPTNTAFEKLEKDFLEELFKDQKLARETVLHHVVHGMICCAGVSRRNPFFDITERVSLGTDMVSVRRSNGGRIYIDSAQVTDCDYVADNGVVHGVDRVLLPKIMADEAAERTDGQRVNPINNIFKALLGGIF